jgi:hypothetical protein
VPAARATASHRRYVTSGDFGWETAHGAVTRRPPISLYTMVPRTEGDTHDAKVWHLSIVQAPFLCRAVPNLCKSYDSQLFAVHRQRRERGRRCADEECEYWKRYGVPDGATKRHQVLLSIAVDFVYRKVLLRYFLVPLCSIFIMMSTCAPPLTVPEPYVSVDATT